MLEICEFLKIVNKKARLDLWFSLKKLGCESLGKNNNLNIKGINS